MANAIYPLFKQSLFDADANTDLDDGTVKVALIDLAIYTYSSAHQFWSSAVAAVIGTPQTLLNTTVVNGVFDADATVFSAVAPGVPAGALIFFVDTGSAATSRLVTYLDTGITGLPITPSGGDILIPWHANGIFAL